MYTFKKCTGGIYFSLFEVTINSLKIARSKNLDACETDSMATSQFKPMSLCGVFQRSAATLKMDCFVKLKHPINDHCYCT